MKITLVGMGSGTPGSLTMQGLNALREAELIIGARRLLESLPDGCTGNRAPLYKIEEICALLRTTEAAHVAVAYSGDTGFYSGASALCRALDAAGLPYMVCPGLSSVQLLAVSKTFGADAVRAAAAAGQRAFGENYVQEALDKMAYYGARGDEQAAWLPLKDMPAASIDGVPELQFHRDLLEHIEQGHPAGKDLARRFPAGQPHPDHPGAYGAGLPVPRGIPLRGGALRTQIFRPRTRPDGFRSHLLHALLHRLDPRKRREQEIAPLQGHKKSHLPRVAFLIAFIVTWVRTGGKPPSARP